MLLSGLRKRMVISTFSPFAAFNSPPMCATPLAPCAWKSSVSIRSPNTPKSRPLFRPAITAAMSSPSFQTWVLAYSPGA
ncbi:hypothetical protein D3C72_1959380 [compost metagenome]